MLQWRVTGLDSKSGKGRSEVIEAATERDAQIAANDLGIMVERVEAVENDHAARDAGHDEHPVNLDVQEHVDISNTPPKNNKKRLVATARGLVESDKVDEEFRSKRRIRSIQNPFSAEENSSRMSMNRVGEIAAGVLLGLVLFSCISPCVILGILELLADIGAQNRSST